MASRRRYVRSTRPRRRFTRRTSRRTIRSTRSRRPARRMMSRKRILNISTNKKRDNMAPFAADSTGTSGGVGPVTIAGSTGGVFIYCATARDRVSAVGDGTASSVRQNDMVYMRGLKESIFMSTSTPASWRWRRICFDLKNTFAFNDALQTSAGWTRYLWNSAGTTRASSLNLLIFEGQSGVDWFDPFTAKLDTSRVKVMYDKTRVLNSGNSLGRFYRYKHWYPMNKNLQYGNDENGEAESGDIYASNTRFGMGNFYVVDLFDCTDTSTNPGSSLTFSPEATLYWHEK
jgi:hypothetical protein